MEELYTVLLLHAAGKPISKENIKKVLEAAGARVDEGRIRALIASLEGVDIGKVMEEAIVPTAASAPAEKEERKEEEEEKKEEEAAAGLGLLFAR